MKQLGLRIVNVQRWAVALGACAALVGCAGSMDAGAGGVGAGATMGASPYDVTNTAVPATDSNATTAPSGTKLYVTADQARVNIAAAGSSTPVIWAKLTTGDILGFGYLDNAYKYAHGGTSTELLPEGPASGMVASAIVAPNAEIGLPTLNLTGTTQPHVLIVRGPQTGGSFGYILSPCGNATCSNGPSDSTLRTAAANQPITVGNDYTLEFRSAEVNGVAKTVFALKKTTTTSTGATTDTTSSPSTTTTGGTNAAPVAPTAPPPPPTPPTSPTATKKQTEADDSWSMTDWLLLGAGVLGGYYVWTKKCDWFDIGCDNTKYRTSGSGDPGASWWAAPTVDSGWSQTERCRWDSSNQTYYDIQSRRPMSYADCTSGRYY